MTADFPSETAPGQPGQDAITGSKEK